MKLTITQRILTALATFVVALFLFNLAYVYRYSETDETRQADCAIVAGAGISGNVPSPIFQQRLNHALWLWQNGYTRHLILTGGLSPGARYSDAEVARLYLVDKGVPPGDVLIEETSTITRENLRNAKIIMDEHHFQTALLVSDPLHMRRIMLMAQDDGIHGWSSPTRTSRIQSWSAKAAFMLREAFYYTGYSALRLL
ncbi:MAG TPA: YdcF family protein [Scandinavium sp.]|jgi:uncharacterized SAM-binding protein YcdF (DUF218 family)|uniref:YdcF family protein n=1 Tax=Scandinavium sp. TaxID=2830653 RepID=UPI002E344ACE|nr:YdcF family protein [Scandinavium sp.]HEX4500103.1 YdcF family protein [Scandinavium sp.]